MLISKRQSAVAINLREPIIPKNLLVHSSLPSERNFPHEYNDDDDYYDVV